MFRNVNGSWVATDQTGWTLDRAATKANLLKAILAGKDTAQVEFRRAVPDRNVKLLAQRGVLWHVAAGTSSYAGSPDFREKNILVGAGKLDNFFIAPGHEFNFNEEIGQIDASTGFVKGFVISGGTLTKEDGGGICQVSTTIFRALYQAGLPITERHEHSHRVKYYDPVGYEATVYAPSKNLRMKNDTGKHLFIQAGWDTARQTLRFDVFGANTGRSVTVSRPVITDFKAPADPSYTPDDRVAPGGRRLLDQPMQGMTSVITRTVKAGGKVVSRDTLKSVYKPWGAVYGVNPADPRLKQ
ncbi:VanW family protein [Deinococcus sp. ME38]